MSSIELSEEQRAFVESTSTAVILHAGAGSGKTEVVVHRIARILSETPTESFRVLALSYTVKAADELRERTKTRLGSTGDRVEAETIHGFAHGLLRQHGSRIGLIGEPELLRRDEDRVDLLVTWLRDTGRPVPEDPRAELSRLDVDRARCSQNALTEVWREALSSVNAVDYQAMLEMATELLDGRWMSKYLRRVYRHIVIDEAQNLTRAQMRFLRKLIGSPTDKHISFALVGDSRQSIVGFAGAESSLMDELAKEYKPLEVRLRTNYRSAQSITSAAHRVASALDGANGTNSPQIYPAPGIVETAMYRDEETEGAAVASRIVDLLTNGIDSSILAPGESNKVRPEEIAVLGRTAASLTATRLQLIHLGIANSSGSSEKDWLESTAGNVVLESIGLKSAPQHRYAYKRLCELAEPRGQGWNSVSEILESSTVAEVHNLAPALRHELPGEMISNLLAMQIDDAGWSQDLATIKSAWDEFTDLTPLREQTYSNFQRFISRLQQGNTESAGVRLLTIHRAQGREFKVVFLVACNDGQIPDFRAKDEESIRAELRAFYVAITRAARALYITRAAYRRTRFGDRRTEPSKFLRLVA